MHDILVYDDAKNAKKSKQKKKIFFGKILGFNGQVYLVKGKGVF